MFITRVYTIENLRNGKWRGGLICPSSLGNYFSSQWSNTPPQCHDADAARSTRTTHRYTGY